MAFVSTATAKVLAAELPKLNESESRILYPASLKASNDLGMGYYAQFFWIKMKFEAPPVADELLVVWMIYY